jgi:predicted transcriptional regulator
MAEQVEKAMRAEHRTRSALVREGLRTYISIRQFPEEAATPAELRAVRRGRAAYERGDYVTLDEFRRQETMARSPHRARAKVP